MAGKTDSRITVRMAERADAQAIRRIMQDSFDKYRKDAGIQGKLEALEETVADIERDMDVKSVFLALLAGEPVGSVRVTLDAEARSAYISRLGVCGVHGRQGVGRALMRAVDTLLDRKGIQRVSLHTAVTNKPLMVFYRSMGFRTETISHDRGYPRACLVKEMGEKTGDHDGTGEWHGFHHPMQNL